MEQEIFYKIDMLYKMHKKGLLGGEVMPEDSNPGLEKSSKENYLYFTLPMALNYQRNSYTLWANALKTYADETTNFVFSPNIVVDMPFSEVQTASTKYGVALQKQKQTEIWIKLCNTIATRYNGDIRMLFNTLDADAEKVRTFMQGEAKKDFPYLSGNKICNYWLYVLYQYTNMEYKDISCLTVAPDTRVIKATHALGIISDDELTSANVSQIVREKRA